MKSMKIITLEEHYRTHAIEKDVEKLVPHDISPWMFRPDRPKRCRMRFLQLQDDNGPVRN